jgi:hypothetical protein
VREAGERPGLAVVALLLTAVPAAASMVRRATLEESVRMSDAIVLGRVLGQRTVRLDDGTVATAVRVQVEEGLKGRIGAGSVIEVTAWGGETPEGRFVAVGEATYRRGERVLLQLEVIDGRLHTLGLAARTWTVPQDAAGERHLTRDLSGLGLVGDAEMTEGPLPLTELRRSLPRLLPLTAFATLQIAS